ncbi:MAG: hypothetical protein KUG68_04275 [Flavobacteriaceae bacterium]|nr:hypothetical protein [Flavobacteriaceae bacterium]
MNDNLYINNAGIVLLHPYIKVLFEKLGLTENDAFISEEKQLIAPHYLQYLITGLSETEESFLTFNKMLCGLKIETKISNGIDISSEEESLLNSLLEAVIQQWSALGETSLSVFRETFLLRECRLNMQESEWNLKVVEKSFDMLLDRLPYSYSHIKLPWMDKMIQVIWR